MMIKKTRAIILPAYNRNMIRALLGLSVGEVELPTLKENDVLVKVLGAPCNPSDLAFLQGNYNIVKPLPTVPGFEGSGLVVEAGSSKTEPLVGKKISFFIQDNRPGSWAEYAVVDRNSLIVLNENMAWQQAACFSVNPVTALALVEIAEKSKTRALVQNAAGGQVARFVRKMAAEKGIAVIDIVRKEDRATTLEAEGALHVVVETHPDFKEQLTTLCQHLDAHIALDAVAGQQGGQLFNALPENSQMVVYGGLSGKRLSDINTIDLIFKNKHITGYNLPQWKNRLKQEDFDNAVLRLQQKFIDGTYATKIQGEIPFNNVVQGLRNYITHMSLGKILLIP